MLTKCLCYLPTNLYFSFSSPEICTALSWRAGELAFLCCNYTNVDLRMVCLNYIYPSLVVNYSTLIILIHRKPLRVRELLGRDIRPCLRCGLLRLGGSWDVGVICSVLLINYALVFRWCLSMFHFLNNLYKLFINIQLCTLTAMSFL